jgi:hypothetical protein
MDGISNMPKVRKSVAGTNLTLFFLPNWLKAGATALETFQRFFCFSQFFKLGEATFSSQW